MARLSNKSKQRTDQSEQLHSTRERAADGDAKPCTKISLALIHEKSDQAKSLICLETLRERARSAATPLAKHFAKLRSSLADQD